MAVETRRENTEGIVRHTRPHPTDVISATFLWSRANATTTAAWDRFKFCLLTLRRQSVGVNRFEAFLPRLNTRGTKACSNE